jgi:hypothetical protein
MKEWVVHLGVQSPVLAVPLRIKDRSGFELHTQAIDGVTSAAIQEGVNLLLVGKAQAVSPHTVVEELDPVFDRILNLLSFRLLHEIQPIALSVVEDRPESESRDGVFAPGYAPLGRGRFTWFGFSYQGGVPPAVSVTSDTRTEAAIAWFLRGTRGSNPTDSFAAYWLALEALAPAPPEAPLSMRCCGAALRECPACGRPTSGPVGMRNRLRAWLTSTLGRTSEEFDELWDLRNDIFHGSRAVFPRMLRVAKLALLLRALAVHAIKGALGIPSGEPPFQADTGGVVAALGLTLTIPGQS